MGISDNYDTKHKIADALEKVMETKAFSKISVTDISVASGLSRQTFYRYFIDIYDLANWLHSDRNQLSQIIFDQNKNIAESFYYAMATMQRYKNFYCYIVNAEGPNSFFEYYSQTIEAACIIHIGKENISDETYLSIRLYSIGSAHLICEWIKKQMTDSPQVLSAHIANSLPKNLARFYE